MASAMAIANGLNSITTKFQQLNSVAQSCNAVNAPLLLINQGPWPKVYRGVYEAAQEFQKQGAALSSSNVTFDADSAIILDSVANYAKVSDKLLTTMIGKITTSESVAALVKPQGYQVFNALDQSDDQLFYGLIDRVPSKEAELNKLAERVEDLERKTVKAYTP